MRSRRFGFSLTELMVVCVVASVLAAVAVPSFTKAKEMAHKSELQAAVRAFQTAEELFLDTYGGFAEDWQDLEMNLRPGIAVVDYIAVSGTYWRVLIRHSNSLVRCVGAYESSPLCWSPAEEWGG